MTTSWVIRRKGDKGALFETFNPKIVAALNTANYEAVPIEEYLQEFNRTVKARELERESDLERARR
jgi:hypothetical protein